MRILFVLIAIVASLRANPIPQPAEDLLFAESDSAKIGIHLGKGASITHLSWKGYPKNAVNAYDPGRLIQQSYYAGARRHRRAEGQHKAWSP